ncbi:MAG: DUF2937 family protein [Pseudomonadota bacterium]
MILRIVAMACGLTGAAGMSQFPEFAQQYLQRLAGKVDQLESQVAEIDASAASFQMSRDEYLADLGTSRTGAEAARKAEGEITLFQRLGDNVDAFREAGPFGRLVQAYRVADVDLAQRTFGDYKPALPLTAEGAAFAGLGFAAGYGIWSMIWGLLGWPIRRRRRRRLAELERHHAEAHADDARFEDHSHDDDDDAFIEYEGDIAAAMSKTIPDITLRAHDGSVVDLSMLTAPIAIFTYPLMGRPGVAFPEGWEEVDDADNATAMACSFRDAYDMMRQAGIEEVFGISSQDTDDQREAVYRLSLPYTLLSDPDMAFAFGLDLPRFILDHQRYVSPSVLILQQGRVLAGLHPIKDASRAAPRLLSKLEEARAAHQQAMAE